MLTSISIIFSWHKWRSWRREAWAGLTRVIGKCIYLYLRVSMFCLETRSFWTGCHFIYVLCPVQTLRIHLNIKMVSKCSYIKEHKNIKIDYLSAAFYFAYNMTWSPSITLIGVPLIKGANLNVKGLNHRIFKSLKQNQMLLKDNFLDTESTDSLHFLIPNALSYGYKMVTRTERGTGNLAFL